MQTLLSFYSLWGLFFHFFFYLELVPNTYTLAVFILLVSFIFQWIYPGYYFVYPWKYIPSLLIGDIVTHYLPVIYLKKSNDLRVLVYSLLLYLAIFELDHIIYVYEDPIGYTEKVLKVY